MSLYPFCHTVRDEHLGVALAYDVECEIDLSVEMDGGVPIVSVDGVYVDGRNLYQGNALSKLIAAALANAAEDDDDLICRAIEGEGFVYRGLGGNDPDGVFTRRAF